MTARSSSLSSALLSAPLVTLVTLPKATGSVPGNAGLMKIALTLMSSQTKCVLELVRQRMLHNPAV